MARARDLTQKGLSREALRRLVAKGELERGARGVYLSSESAQSEHRDLLIVATRVPDAVVCLLSALSFHQLTDEMPHAVWIAIALKARAPVIDTVPLRVIRFSEAPLSAGVERHEIHGVSIRVFSPGKTVPDCFKFRNKVGIDVAVAALREGWRRKRFTIDELSHFARICRVSAVMQPYLEAVVA